MLARVMRAMSATEKAARVSEGRIRLASPSEPAAGSQFRWTAKTMISMRPSQ